jgi:5-methyltetrahydrofolate--homocysteine methyltransferase
MYARNAESEGVKMTNAFLTHLSSTEVLIADGATGTNYQLMGIDPGVRPEDWVLDAPQNVLALHRAFLDAGSDILLTNSFGATRLRMRESKYANRVTEINRRAVELAREAASGGKGTLVGGSMGSTGQLMVPFGSLTHSEAVDNYAEQAAALAEAGADFLLLETFYALEEALAASEGVRKAGSLPLVVSFSYDQGQRTMMGVRPSQTLDAFAPLGVAAIGANCGKTLEAMEKVVEELAAEKKGIPIWAKPNAGLPKGIPPKYDITPWEMAESAVRLVRAGARIVGGCCGTTPAHIAAISAVIHSL